MKKDGFLFHFCGVGFTREEVYDLEVVEMEISIAESVLSDLKDPSYSKLEGKRTIGSVIRICKAIHQQELADEIYNMHIYMYVCVCIFNHMVKKCFILHQHQDPKDSSRPRFGLNVEPSMFQIKCNCCKGRKFPKRLK